MKLRICEPGEIGAPRLVPGEPLPLSTDNAAHCQHASKRLLVGLRRGEREHPMRALPRTIASRETLNG
jgi:hypothetical protein